MKKKFTTFLMLLSVYTHSIYSQQDLINVYQIEYERALTAIEGTAPFINNYEYSKFIEFDKSIHKITAKTKTTNKLEEDSKDNSSFYFNPSGKNINVIFKDYKKNEFYYNAEVAFKYFVVKDSLSIFNWNILKDKKEILGFSCQLATMDFRGRKYEAWFATELPIGGPWKFDGLPGMILEIKSVDNFIAFKAIGIKNTVVKLKDLPNPFNTKKTITWQEFKNLYKKKAIELISYRPNESAGGIESSRGGIEIYIEEDDKEYNEALKKLPNK